MAPGYEFERSKSNERPNVWSQRETSSRDPFPIYRNGAPCEEGAMYKIAQFWK